LKAPNSKQLWSRLRISKACAGTTRLSLLKGITAWRKRTAVFSSGERGIGGCWCRPERRPR